MQRILVYGSLRKEEYNYNRILDYFGVASIRVVEENKVVEGFEMFNLGPYPAIYPNPDKKIICDLIEVTEEVDEFIYDMEIGAGYEQIKLNDGVIYIYYQKPHGEIISGDWKNKYTEIL